jgi:hypothetical protein
MFTEGPVLPARSDTEAASRRRITVPSEHSVTAISITAPCELDGLITQSVAEPIFDTSAAVKPDTASENVSAYANEALLTCDAGWELHEAEGAERSTSTAVDSAFAPGANPPTLLFTDSAANLSWTVPSEQEAAVIVNNNPEEAEVLITQPVALPMLVMSLAIRLLIALENSRANDKLAALVGEEGSDH